jgi:hypothetical protein
MDPLDILTMFIIGGASLGIAVIVIAACLSGRRR